MTSIQLAISGEAIVVEIWQIAMLSDQSGQSDGAVMCRRIMLACPYWPA
jgi:hypothetical protein